MSTDTVTLPRIEKPQDAIEHIRGLLKALDLYESLLERGYGRLHAMEVVLLLDRGRR